MIEVKVQNSNGEVVLLKELPLINGVYHAINSNEFSQLKEHLSGFIKFRRDTNQLITNIETIRNLPFSVQSQEWINKQDTWTRLEKTIESCKPQSALIVGSGNGWLCNLIAKKRIQTVGVGILYYEYDGLETIKHYTSFFDQVLIPPHEIDRFKNKFDLIIFENNLPYVKDYKSALEKAKSLLSLKGQIILPGISVHMNKIEQEKERILELQKKFLDKYQHKINTYDTKMFMDNNDLLIIKELGFSVTFRNNFKNTIKRILKKSVVTCDAIYLNQP